MADVKPPRPLREDDDRNQFDCGRESLNGWFRRHGWANHLSGASRVNVLCDVHDDKIVGYVTLSSGQIERTFLTKARQRNQPDPLPATLLGQLAVDRAFQGQGHATSLLIFALNTAVRAAEIVGSIAVITHPLDDDVRALYARWGFEGLPFDPHLAMIIRIVDLRRNGFVI